jgi:hypothetical protein
VPPETESSARIRTLPQQAEYVSVSIQQFKSLQADHSDWIRGFERKAWLNIKLSIKGKASGREDTALTTGASAGASEHEDVTGHTPVSAPGVLDLVVVRRARGAVADGENTVVERSAACWAVEHTAGVELEAVLVGLNGDRYWLVGNSGDEGGVRVDWHIGEAGDGGGSGASLLACAISAGVGVCRLSADTLVVNDVLEGIVHQTAVATLVALSAGAVNELLLGERHEGAGLDEVDTLNRAGGGERPAGAALALVLHWGDGTLGNPIDGGWCANGVEQLEADDAGSLLAANGTWG